MKKKDYNRTLKVESDFEQMFRIATDNDGSKKQPVNLEKFLKSYSEKLDAAESSVATESKAPLSFKQEIQQPLIIAALSGNISPNELISDLQDNERNILLSRLKSDFTIATSKNNMQWRLKQSKREMILLSLISSGTLEGFLSASLPETDEFGNMLRRIMGNIGTIDTSMMSDSNLLLMCSVLESIGKAYNSSPDISAVKAELRQRSMLGDYQLLAENFIGREEQIRILTDFIHASNSFDWDGKLLIGQGGAGKSAIVARISQLLLSPKIADVVILDFDRPGLSPTNTNWMDEEVSRQLSGQYPKMAFEQANLRKGIRKRLNEQQFSRSVSGYTSSEQERFTKSLLQSIWTHLSFEKVSQIPLVIILDSVEEVFQNHQFDYLYKWLDEIAEVLNPLNLKVIFSGRLSVRQIMPNAKLDINPIQVNEFDEQIAELFLKQIGLLTNTARSIVTSKAFPLRPLELKVIAKTLREENISFAQLLKEIRRTGPVARDIFMSTIYRRVLSRIDDPILQAIAYPGLILRFINADIVLNILAPILHPTINNIVMAQEIVDKLANYTWLAHQDPNGDVWHSLDLRRSMLKLITLEQNQKIIEIRQRAIVYFGKLGSPAADAEALYHQLFLIKFPKEGNDLDLRTIEAAALRLGNSVEELPKAAQVLINFALGNGVAHADISLFPDRFFSMAYESTGRRLCLQGQFADALKLFKRSQRLHITLEQKGNSLADYWETNLLFSTANWKLIQPVYTNNDRNRRPTVLDIALYLFPRAVINPNQTDTIMLQELFREATEMGSLEKNLLGPDGKEIIGRIVFSLVLLNAQGKLTTERHYIAKLLDFYIMRRENTDPINEINLMRYLLGTTPTNDFRLSTTRLCLDSTWLKNTGQYFANPDDTVMHKIITRLDRYGTINSLLTSIDSDPLNQQYFRDNIIDLEKLLPRQIYEITAGKTYFFRDPLRFSLTEAIKKHGQLNSVSTLMRRFLPFVSDTEPEMFLRKMKSNMLFNLSPYIELLDRTKRLDEFMRNLIEFFPRSHKIHQVQQACQQWEDARRSLILNKS